MSAADEAGQDRSNPTQTASLPDEAGEACLDRAPMRILRDGTWLYEGTPIARERMVRLFASVLRREEDGGFWLVTPVERVGVEVEDAPFVALEMKREGTGEAAEIAFRTNLGDWVTADGEHPLRVEEDADNSEPRPYIRVRGGLDALIARSVFYELVELAETVEQDGKEVIGVWSRNSFFPLGRL